MEPGSKKRRRSIRNLRRSSSNFSVPNRTVLCLEAEGNPNDGCTSKDDEESALAGYGSAWVDDKPITDTMNNLFGSDKDSQNNDEDNCSRNFSDLENISLELASEGTENKRELEEFKRKYFSQLSVEKPRQGDSFEEMNIAYSSTENTVNSPFDFSAASNSDLDAHVSSLDIAGFLYSPDTIVNEMSESYIGQQSLNLGYVSYHGATAEAVMTPSPVHAIPSCSNEQDTAETPAVIHSSTKDTTFLCADTFTSSENSIKSSISATDVSSTALVSLNEAAQLPISTYTISTPVSNPTTSSLKVTITKVSKLPTNAVPPNPPLPTIKEKKQKPSAQKSLQKEKTVKSRMTMNQKLSTSKQRPKSWNPDPIASSNLRSHPKYTSSKSEKQKYPGKQKPAGVKSKTKSDTMLKKPPASKPDDDEPLSPVDQLDIAQSNFSEATPEGSSVLGTSMAFVIQQLSSKLQSLQTGLGISSPRSLGQRQLESDSVISSKETGETSEGNRVKDSEKFDSAENAKNKEGTQKGDEISNDCMFEISKAMCSSDMSEKCIDPPILTTSTENSEKSTDSLKIPNDRAMLNNAPNSNTVEQKMSKHKKSKKKTRLSLDKKSREKLDENLNALEQNVEEPSVTPDMGGEVHEKYAEMQASLVPHSEEMITLIGDLPSETQHEMKNGKNEEIVSLASGSHAVEMNSLMENLLSMTQNEKRKDKNEEGITLTTGSHTDPLLDSQTESQISLQCAESDVPPKNSYINMEMSKRSNLAGEESPFANTKQVFEVEGGKKKKEKKSKTKSARRSSRLFVPEEINLESPTDPQRKENVVLSSLLSGKDVNTFVKNSVNSENTEIGNNCRKEVLGDLVQSPNKDSSTKECASALLEEYNSPLKDRSKLGEIIDFVSLWVDEDVGQEINNMSGKASQKLKRKDKEKRRSSIYKASGDYDGEEIDKANSFSKNVADTVHLQELEEYNSPQKDRSRLEGIIEDFVSMCVEGDAGQEKNNVSRKASLKVRKKDKQRRRSSIYEASGDYDDEEIDMENDLSNNVTETAQLPEESALDVSSGMRVNILSEPSFPSTQLTQTCLDMETVGASISSGCNSEDEKIGSHIDNNSSLLTETADENEIPSNQIAPTESTEHLDTLLPSVRRSSRTSRSRKSWDFSQRPVKDTTKRPSKRPTNQDSSDTDTQLISHHLNTAEVNQTADIRPGATAFCGEDENRITQEVKDYYCNKMYVPPKPRSWETIKESPTNPLNVFTKTRTKRILLFEHGITTAKLQRRRRKSIDLQKVGCGLLTPISDEEFAKKMMDVDLLFDSP